MKVKLFDFQEDALAELHKRRRQACSFAAIDSPQAISFSAPTGAGKTIVMTQLFEEIFFGRTDPNLPAEPDAVVLWISDMPELNEQTRRKIESKSDRIRVGQLITIDSAFDSERLAGGNIYFMNTQKLGTDKLLTKKGDTRQYTIWETISNTARAQPNRFYVVIDEAHRGMRTDKNIAKAQSIVQKFLLGSPEDGLCAMPLVLGLSATPRRFEDLLTGTDRTVHRVHVTPEQVQGSGLLKDRVLINYPKDSGEAEMSLLGEAAVRWQAMGQRWTTYCKSENEAPIHPILVVQVEDGGSAMPTKTDLKTALATIDAVLSKPLAEGEIAHTFHETGPLTVNDRTIRHVEASRIEEDPNIRVVLFKMNLSTGWDCPRAEVMMSFRPAQDHTYIAQLLGRMVRAPLARRVEKDAALNDVHLYLPHYDRKTVEQIVQDLKNVEDVPPVETGVGSDLIVLSRRPDTEAIFAATQRLITYRVNAVRRQSHLRRLMGLGRALTQDRIDADAQTNVTNQIVAVMAQELERIRWSGNFEQQARRITGIGLETVELRRMTITDERTYQTIHAASADIERQFEEAGRRLGNGLHMTYRKAQGDRDADDVKVELIVIADNTAAMQALEDMAAAAFSRLFEQHKQKIIVLNEQRRQQYEKLKVASAKPEAIPWILPDSISFRRKPDASVFDKHLYVGDNGEFRTELGTWEQDVLEEELRDPTVVGWLRNLDRKPWSLELPYRKSGTYTSMFPDLLIVRQDGDKYLFDILEPHDPSRDDNAEKAVGLAEFAENHWTLFDRIQLIRRQTSPSGKLEYYRLDVGKESVRQKVRAISSNNELNHVFANYAEIRR